MGTDNSGVERATAEADVRERILREFHENGRASYAAVAQRLGVPRTAVVQTVQGAIARGELRLAVSVSPDLLGLHRFAYVQIGLDSAAGPARQALVGMPETTFVADIAGPFPLEAELRVGSDQHLRDALERITLMPGVRDVRTHIYEHIDVNQYSPLRTGRSTLSIDDVDRRLIRSLQENCRASFRELGDAAELSASGARLRYERLIAHRAVKVVGIPVRGDRSETPSLGVGIRTRGRVAELLPRFRALEPEFLAVCVGGYDFIATLSGGSAAQLLDVTDRLRDLEAVSAVDVWANLRVVKEQYGDGDRIPVPTAG